MGWDKEVEKSYMTARRCKEQDDDADNENE